MEEDSHSNVRLDFDTGTPKRPLKRKREQIPDLDDSDGYYEC